MYMAHVILGSLRRLLELEWGMCVESFLEKMTSGKLRVPYWESSVNQCQNLSTVQVQS